MSGVQGEGGEKVRLWRRTPAQPGFWLRASRKDKRGLEAAAHLVCGLLGGEGPVQPWPKPTAEVPGAPLHL